MSNVIFYPAHQDDELLTFGPSIITHLRGGHDVHVVLLTDGSNSGVLKTLNGERPCSWHGKTHDPVAEGYNQGWYDLDGQYIYLPKRPIDKEQFSSIRTREMISCLEMLGVKTENIHLEHFVDGQLTIDDAKSVFLKYDNQFPDARHKTHTFYDPHKDHAAAGIALNELFKAGKIADARFYVKPSIRKDGLPGFKERSGELPKLLKAMNAYKYWDPEYSYFAVGFHSVPKSFALLEEDEYSQIHASE